MSERITDETRVDALPDAEIEQGRRFSIIWLIPLLAALIGLGHNVLGQDAREEINREPGGFAGGANYGWACREGTLGFDPGEPVIHVGDHPLVIGFHVAAPVHALAQ